MFTTLTETEIRVVASLIEKQITTPEYYPLTINALTAACNQKTNREPIVSYDEATVLRVIESLREKNLVYVFLGAGSRTIKYKHRLPEMYELDEAETAVLTALMLRGAQTLGEIRTNANRFFAFDDAAQINQALESLINREPALTVKLERQSGQKELRFAHLLTGEIPVVVNSKPERETQNDRVSQLETEVAQLKTEVAELRQMFESFRRQFE